MAMEWKQTAINEDVYISLSYLVIFPLVMLVFSWGVGVFIREGGGHYFNWNGLCEQPTPNNYTGSYTFGHRVRFFLFFDITVNSHRIHATGTFTYMGKNWCFENCFLVPKNLKRHFNKQIEIL